MKDIRIRPVERRDLRDVHEMIVALAAHHGEGAAVTLADLRRDLFGVTPWLRMLVAEGDGIIGYASLGQRIRLGDGQRGLEVEHLFVRESLRGKGLGRRLLAAAEETARRLEGGFVTIGTHPDNAAARDAYRACGYEPLPHDPLRFRKGLLHDAGAV